MIANRFKRILLPLIALIWPIALMNGYSKQFSYARNEGHDIIKSLSEGLSVFNVKSPSDLLPWSTEHLWFLNY